MSNTNNFGLVGIGNDVRLGKGGPRLIVNTGTSTLEVKNPTNSGFYNLQTLNLTSVDGSFTGDVTINGNLTVSGTTTSIDTQTLNVEDHNITLGNVAVPTDITADGGGLTLLGTTNKTLTWSNSTSNWTSSEHFDLVTGKNYKVNNIDLLGLTGTVPTVFGSSAIIIPNGNNAARPSGSTGMLRINTQNATHELEFWNGASWVLASPNTYSTITGDTGSTVASGNDTLTVTGGTGLSTTVTTDTVTFDFNISEITNTAVTSSDFVLLGDQSSSENVIKRSLANIFSDLNVPNNITSDGILVRTAANTYTSRSVVNSSTASEEGIVITNGNGVSGDISVGLDINGLTTNTTIVGTDEFVIFDGTNNRKVTSDTIKNYISANGVVVREVSFTHSDTTVNIGSPIVGRILRARVDITTAFDANKNLEIGRTGSLSEIATFSDIDERTTGLYVIDNSTNYVASTQLLLTIGSGSTTVGAGRVYIEYIPA